MLSNPASTTLMATRLPRHRPGPAPAQRIATVCRSERPCGSGGRRERKDARVVLLRSTAAPTTNRCWVGAQGGDVTGAGMMGRGQSHLCTRSRTTPAPARALSPRPPARAAAACPAGPSPGSCSALRAGEPQTDISSLHCGRLLIPGQGADVSMPVAHLGRCMHSMDAPNRKSQPQSCSTRSGLQSAAAERNCKFKPEKHAADWVPTRRGLV